MTCIVGLVHRGGVYIGGDSAGISGFHLTVRADEKVFRVGEFTLGFTSSFRMGQLLRYKLTLSAVPRRQSLHRYMSTVFVDSVRECLKAGGFLTVSNGVESGGDFLVGIRGQLFEVCSDFQVGQNSDRMAAVGCGREIALGSLYSTTGNPVERLTTALKAAERFSAGVRRPFLVLGP